MSKHQYCFFLFFLRIFIARSFYPININDRKSLFTAHSFSSLQNTQRIPLSPQSYPHHDKFTLLATETTTSVSLQQQQHKDDKNKILNAIGVPEALKDLDVGQSLKAFRRNVIIDHYNNEISSPILSSSNFTIERVSEKPNIFILRDFLSHCECDLIMNYAMDNTTMTNAETITENDTNSRKNCQVAWLPSSSSSVTATATSKALTSMISNLVSSTANILLSRDVLSHPSASVEDLQVLKYNIGGEFVLHHDGEPRILTVIYYVNGVGGTWFPLASTASLDPCRNMNETKFEQEFMNAKKNSDSIHNKGEALKLGEGFIPGKQGLLLKGSKSGSVGSGREGEYYPEEEIDNPNVSRIKKGDAVAFYNYKNDGSGQFDWRALHTGLPTSKEDGLKWIANHWFRLGHLLDA